MVSKEKAKEYRRNRREKMQKKFSSLTLEEQSAFLEAQRESRRKKYPSEKKWRDPAGKRRGQIRSDAASKNPEIWAKIRLSQIKAKCKRLKIEFNLSEKTILGKIPADMLCPVLGIPMILISPGRMSDNSASVDRIDPSQGYVSSNITIISLRANRIKNNASNRELKLILDYCLRCGKA